MPKPLILELAAARAGSELGHAVRILDLPARYISADGSVFAATVRQDDGDDSLKLPESSCPDHPEGYAVAYGDAGELHLVANTEHGLANGLYDLRRAIQVSSDRDPEPVELLPEGASVPYFEQRDFYHFLTTWRLQGLTCDTFTPEQWKRHLDRMRTLNANRFYFDIWADQYYHPDHPETAINRTFYDSIKDMCSYAHELGMRAGVVLFPCQVPPSVYQAFPEARAVEAKNYLGINMCPSKDWDRILTFDTFLLTYMGKNLDDIIVEMQDPGSCLCELCCSQFPDLVNQFIATYRQVSGGPSGRKIDVCTLHFRDWLEDPGDDDSGVAFPITCLRKKVFEMLPEETTIFDIDNSTLDMGRKNSFKNNYFFFDLDPESGMENQQVFPRVKLRRIESQVKDSVSRGHDGIMAYRMMPFVQHIADYVLFRKCWSPELEIDAVLTELAAEWEIPADKRSTFVKAIRDLDAWWEESDVGALEAAGTAIEQLADVRGVSSYLSDSRDLLRVLRSLGRYLVGNRQKVDRDDFYPPKVLVDEVYAIMKNSRIFEAYTIYQHWVNRSREMIGQRTRWWLKGILFELRTADPARAT